METSYFICLREIGVRWGSNSSGNSRGQEIAVKHSAAPIRDRAGHVIGAVMVFHDVSKERRLRRALAYQATHDALTGLINRREFENRLNEALVAARENEQTHVLLYLDLDQFKLVNDTCGHQAGDRLLKQVTGLLQTRIRASDTIARLGGDEFGVLLQECSAERGSDIAESLRQAIRDFRFIWQDGVVRVGVSIGIVEISSASDSIARCDALRMWRATRQKIRDQSHSRLSTRQQPDRIVRCSGCTFDARRGRQPLERYYQPIVPIARTRQRRHYNCCSACAASKGRIVLPAEFMSAAERYNLMPAIDSLVVQHCARSLAH